MTLPPSSWDQVASAVLKAGFKGDAAVTMTAIAEPESGRVADKVGDVKLAGRPTKDGRTWGVSIGWFQIRSIVEARGDGSERDPDALYGPLQNAKAAFVISGHGTNFKPWTTYNNGLHRPFLGEARAAVDRMIASGGTVTAEGAPVSAAATPTAVALTADVIDLPAGPASADVDRLSMDDPLDLGRLTIFGRVVDRASTLAAPILDLIASCEVQLTSDETSEVQLELYDPDLAWWTAGAFQLGAAAQWADLALAVSATEVGMIGALLGVKLTLRAAGVEALRGIRSDHRGEGVWNDVSPTELAAQFARSVNLRVVAQGTARRSSISRAADKGAVGGSDAHAGEPESSWEVLTRLADEEGFWLFESAGTLYFGRPTWLRKVAPEVRVGWGGGWGSELLDAVTAPRARRARDVSTRDGVAEVELDVELPSWRGRRVRPGMALSPRGLPGFSIDDVDATMLLDPGPNGSITGEDLGRYVVTSVSWTPTDDERGLVRVHAVNPADPPASKPGGDGSSSTTSTPEATTKAPGTPVAGSASALDFVDFALAQAGDTYSLKGGHPSAEIADPSVFDCSGLVGWAAGRAGVKFTGNAASLIAAAIPISVDEATKTRGAILFHPPTSKGTSGHIVISLGDGRTIEARGTKYGVMIYKVEGRGWTKGGKVPGLNYDGKGTVGPTAAAAAAANSGPAGGLF